MSRDGANATALAQVSPAASSQQSSSPHCPWSCSRWRGVCGMRYSTRGRGSARSAGVKTARAVPGRLWVDLSRGRRTDLLATAETPSLTANVGRPATSVLDSTDPLPRLPYCGLCRPGSGYPCRHLFERMVLPRCVPRTYRSPLMLSSSPRRCLREPALLPLLSLRLLRWSWYV